jgi:outer membrane lipoprotein-sorting protein
MKLVPKSPRRARWAVPAGAIAVVAAVTAASVATTAAASPTLPARTPGQLLTEVASHAGNLPQMSGTVVEQAALGVPQLPGMQDPSNVVSMLTGSHTIRLWYGGPAHTRLALPVPLGETDVIHNGHTLWIWQSSSDSVERIVAPPRSAEGTAPSSPAKATPLTPQQAAQQLLKAVGPTTSVQSGPTTTVAGENAYQLVIAPKDSRSLVGRVVIQIDAQHPSVVLGVQVYARGANSPAFQSSFNSISFGAQPASMFAFSPPKGATVHTLTPKGQPNTPSSPPAGAAGVKVIGKNWLTVAVLPASALSALTHGGNAAGTLGQAAQSASAGPGAGAGGGVNAAGVLAGLLKSAKPVHGAWGSGKLVTTSLLSILITSNGHVLVGAVAPSVLYSAAAQVR